MSNPSGLISPYISFLVGKMDLIYESWDQGDEELALSRALKLTYFLVRELKEQLRPDMQKIIKEMQLATKKEGVGFLTEEAERSARARAVARKWLPVFLDKLTDLFDERAYLERTWKGISREDLEKMEDK